jgi:hypothetical protein
MHVHIFIYVYICICIRWLKRSFNVDLQSTQTMSGRIIHPEETVRKIEWIVDQLVSTYVRTYGCMLIIIYISMLFT